MKRFMLLMVVLLSLVILGTTASADVRTSGPGPLRADNGWTSK
jgi:hypothetical protein